MNDRMISSRIQNTIPPFIEDVLEKYSGKNLTRLALGSSHWGPPSEAIDKLSFEKTSVDVHRYGSIMGLDILRNKLVTKLHNCNGLNMDEMELMITAGANQAFANTALTLCDEGDNVLLISPYYFSHKSSLQMVGCKVHESKFNKTTLKPIWEELEIQFNELKPTVVVLTNPNNPSGTIWNEDEIKSLSNLCKASNSWLVVDQTYYEFYYEGHNHVFPCGHKYEYSQIVHIFSLSKSFGIPGWRVGYLVFPKMLSEHLRKVQDTLPTHCSMIGQALAAHVMEHDDLCLAAHGQSWVSRQIGTLASVREAVWDAVQQTGAVRTLGAFYFLVPVPPMVTEDEAVSTLANDFGVLLMHGSPFGAPQHLRLSYGSLPPDDVMSAVTRLKQGLGRLLDLSSARLGVDEGRAIP